MVEEKIEAMVNTVDKAVKNPSKWAYILLFLAIANQYKYSDYEHSAFIFVLCAIAGCYYYSWFSKKRNFTSDKTKRFILCVFLWLGFSIAAHFLSALLFK